MGNQRYHRRLRAAAPTTYPSGAIRTTVELTKYVGKGVWYASKHFHLCQKRFIYAIGTGFENGATEHSIGTEDYRWYRTNSDVLSFSGYPSRKDANLDKLNGYNDWFLFANEGDALAYSNPPCDIPREQKP